MILLVILWAAIAALALREAWAADELETEADAVMREMELDGERWETVD